MAGADGTVRILIADSQPLFREAVRAAMQNQPGLNVVGLAGDGVQAISEAERDRPDLAVLDLNLPNCNGIRATQLIRERVPECRVLFVADTEDRSVLVESVEAGASGFLTKEAPLEELIDAVRAIHRGEMPIPGRLLPTLIAELLLRRRQQDEAVHRLRLLTRREHEVLALLAQGLDNDAIAQTLVISPETVRTHIQNVLGKLGLHSRLEAAAFVVRNALIEELDGHLERV